MDAIICDDYVDSRPKSRKDNLIENEHTAWEQNYQLENAKRSAFEIEDVGKNVMRQMDAQTNQLRNIKGRSLQLDENLDQGDFYIDSMHNQEKKKRIYMFVFGVILIAVLLIIIFFKFV